MTMANPESPERGYSCWSCDNFHFTDPTAGKAGDCRGLVPQTKEDSTIIPRAIPDGTLYWCRGYIKTSRGDVAIP